MTLPSAASVRLRDLLCGTPRPVRVLGGGPAACYLEVAAAAPARLLALVTADATALPDAIQLTLPAADAPLAGLAPGTTGAVGEGTLELPGLRTAPTRWWDPVPHLRAVASADVAAAAARAAGSAALHPQGPVPAPLRDHLDAVAAALDRDDLPGVLAHAHHLLGAGEGSTPTGDDLLAGLVATVLALADASGDAVLLAASRRAGAELAALAGERTTAVSASLLRAAADGAVCLPVAAWLHACTGTGDLDAATHGVLAIGSVSGRDLLTGACRGVALVTARAVPAAEPIPAEPIPARSAR